ncbi:MAG: hypothetical protein WBL56_12975 [Candidatus Acidiferrum sp.]
MVFDRHLWARMPRPQSTVRPAQQKGNAMSFGLYAIGFGILVIGLIYGAFLLHIPAHWIVVGGIVLVGAGILSGVKATRQRDTAA